MKKKVYFPKIFGQLSQQTEKTQIRLLLIGVCPVCNIVVQNFLFFLRNKIKNPNSKKEGSSTKVGGVFEYLRQIYRNKDIIVEMSTCGEAKCSLPISINRNESLNWQGGADLIEDILMRGRQRRPN